MRWLLMFMLLTTTAWADAGTLIPRDKDAPDPAILSLEDMRIRVTIDNGDAHVVITQIFANHSNRIEEGTYRFSLPSSATVSDFAVWDGAVRIPAVVLERRRAEQVYDEARAQAIDPGLLEMGERDSSDPHEASLFTAKITPIAPYGTKRLELEYHQRLTVSSFQQFFALGLKPDAGQSQTARHFSLVLRLSSVLAVQDFATPSKLYPTTVTHPDPQTIVATFEAQNFAFDEDFQAAWGLDPAGADKLQVLTYRDPTQHLPQPGATTPMQPQGPEPGFFEGQLLLSDPKPLVVNARTLILLFDNSLSMQWDKLERVYAALEATLRTLTAKDHFNVLLFNQRVTPFQTAPVPATEATVQQALDFVRASRLRGGTDLAGALTAGLAQCTGADTSLILLTDGGSNRGESILPDKIAAHYAAAWHAAAHPPHTDIYAVGDDANVPFLRQLARQDGLVEQVLSTEPYEFHLKSFLGKIVRTPVQGLTLSAPGTSLIYALDDVTFPGSMPGWVGQYKPSSGTAKFAVHGSEVTVALPERDLSHPQLPRLWAQARVDALLEQIDRDGESNAAIAEIIALSRRYKFVTPYTSFLAVPRSLLRPRVIRPGDPVLRVRTDPAITSVIALFPFGLTKPLRHLSSEDDRTRDPDRLWETRFLAPPEMKDGTYAVRLILRDTHGHTYNEAKTFVIASTPPTVRLQLSRVSLHPGETLEIRATASASTRTLTARLAGAAAVPLHWTPAAHASTGLLTVPASLPVGRYTLTVTAEDIAHNLGTQEVPINVTH